MTPAREAALLKVIEEHEALVRDADLHRRVMPVVDALLHQIDIGDFTNSMGHEAKMLKPLHDLLKVLGRKP